MRSRRALAVALTLAGTLPASASASQDQPRIAAYQAGAVRHFGHGTMPPCGTPTIEWADLSAYGPRVAAQVPRDVIDGTDVYTCVVQLDRWWWQHSSRGKRCRTIMHEYGHLYGLDHTARGIMAVYLERVGRFWPCDHLMRGGRAHG